MATTTNADIAARIRHAFAGVTLGGGVGLREAQAIDGYRDDATRAAERAGDEKDDWKNIPVSALNECYSSLSFFDAEGMRFHLPAYLIADLGGEYLQDLSFQLAFLSDYTISQFALLSPDQRGAVRAYLLHIVDNESFAFSRPQIVRALEEYWTE